MEAELLVRRAVADDVPVLWRMLGHAVTWRGGAMTVEELRAIPELRHYVDGWTPEQGGVVALRRGEVVGAAWLRMLGADDPGYGFVRAGVPELSMGLDPGVRGRGIGARLLVEALAVAHDVGYDAVSLSVERDNVVAHRLYRRAGFEVVASLEAADTMLWRSLRGRDTALSSAERTNPHLSAARGGPDLPSREWNSGDGLDYPGGQDVTLRAERPEDADPVGELVAEAFGPSEPQIAALVEALRPYSRAAPGGTPMAWVVERGDELLGHELLGDVLLGHVMLTRCRIDAWEELVPALLLSPLSVRPQAQGQGFGSALVDAALRAAEESGCPAVFLEGAPSFYGRLGFEAAEPLGFRRPSLRIPLPAFQVRRLSSYRPWMTGTVVYAPPFWDLDCVGLRDRAMAEEIERTFG